MRSALRFLLVLALLCPAAGIAGCGDAFVDANADGKVAGAKCDGDDACADGSFCERGPEFPAGLCTVRCQTHEQCPADTRCVGAKGGLCLTSCTSESDCRDGYLCEETDAAAGGADVLVCIGGD